MDKSIPPKYLPIGTIVKLRKFNIYVMIGGFKAKTKEGDRSFDYIGCTYPIGITNPDQMVLFNHPQIEELVFMGFEDNRDLKFKKVLSDADYDKKGANVTEEDYTIEGYKPYEEKKIDVTSNSIFE